MFNLYLQKIIWKNFDDKTGHQQKGAYKEIIQDLVTIKLIR